MKPQRQIACRKQVAALLKAVMNDEVEAKEAINTWPCYCNQDISVICAYTMLWYWESDDERRFQEMFYADVQLEQMKRAVEALEKGWSLPPDLIIGYQGRLAPYEYTETGPLRDWYWKLIKTIENALMASTELLANLSRIIVNKQNSNWS